MDYIDLHAHILPGLDDGPETLEESLQMAEMALKQGINQVVATPHVVEGLYENNKSVILERTRLLQEALKKKGCFLEIIPGAEIHISDNIMDLLERGELLTINDAGKYILLELPHSQSIPPYIDNLVFQLSIKGVRTIIPHPERNISVQENPNILIPLIRQGVLMQSTLSSFTGHFGAEVTRTAEILLKHHMVHLLATDMHSIGGRLRGFTRALEKVTMLVGKENLRAMIVSGPQLVLQGREVDLPEPCLYEKESPWGNLRNLFKGIFTSVGQDKSQGM